MCSLIRHHHKFLVKEAGSKKPADFHENVAHHFFVGLIKELLEYDPPESIDWKLAELHMIEQDAPDIAPIDRVEFLKVLTKE